MRQREGIRLAFVRVVQALPPRQRAALLLHDVLDWSVAEVADMLATTEAAINSALQRARATIARPPPPADPRPLGRRDARGVSRSQRARGPGARRIATASSDQLDTWTTRIFSVATLTELLAD